MPTNGVDRVYLARHGRTALNVAGRLRGLSDPPLDEVGQVQAKRLAKALAAFGPMVVISSPLQRAVTTAQVIGAAAHIRVVIRETEQPISKGPSVFAKFTRSLADPYSDARRLRGQGDSKVDVVVVIDRHAYKVSAQIARVHVAGLPVGQDFSQRRLQLSGRID